MVAPPSGLRSIPAGSSLVLFVLGATACQSGLDAELAQDTQAIVNGDVDHGDDAVVALTHRGQQFCTGTLIGERTVVTAAHCLPPNIDVSADSMLVFFGRRIDDPDGVSVRVTEAVANPSWSSSTLAGDIGLIALADPAPVDPVPLAYADLDATSKAGDGGRVVGFGITEAEGGGNGVKREGAAEIARITQSSIYLAPGQAATCNGDSGGPLFLNQNGAEVLAGIHSRSDCVEQQIAERLDVHLMDFVQPFVSRHEGEAACSADGLCAADCTEPDPDCPCAGDGICDSMCMHPAADADCVGACSIDGVCNEDCDADGDCGCVGDECGMDCAPGEPCDEDGAAGCSAAGGGGSVWWVALALMGLAVRRRRTS